MRNFQFKSSNSIGVPRASEPKTIIQQNQGGPFNLLQMEEGFAFGGTSVISIGAYGSLQLIFDLTGMTVIPATNSLVYFTILFSEGIPTSGYVKAVDVANPLPMTEYLNGRFPSPKNTTAVNIRLVRTEDYRNGYNYIYGEEGSLAYQSGENTYVAVRELFQSVQIIQTCFGFIATSAASSFPIIDPGNDEDES